MIENYYILLGLDPSVQDPVKIGEAITQKVGEWSRDRNNPAKSAQAQKYLGEASKMRRMLSEPPRWIEEANAAKKILNEQKKSKYEAINADIKIFLASKKHLWQSEFDLLQKKYSIPEGELKALITVSIQKDKVDAKKGEDITPYDTSSMKNIGRDLEILNKKNLYDFLEVASTSSLKILLEKTDEKDKSIKAKASKDAETTAAGTLIGHCRNIFNAEDKRKSYDKAVQNSGLEKLNRVLDTAGSDGKIDPAEFALILESGSKLGFDKATVSDYIEKYARQKKWLILVAFESQTENLTDCGYCATPNPPTAKFCSNCSLPFVVNCPSCGQENRNNVRACIKCGFSVGDMPNALPLIRDALDALNLDNITEAEICFIKAERFWQNHPDIVNGREQINLKKTSAEASIDTIQRFIQQSQYYEAQAALRKIPARLVADMRIRTFNERIARSISEAESLISKSRTARSNPEKETFLLEALRVCADCREAETLLTAIPPEVPTGLTCQVENRLISLRWIAVKSKDTVVYRVVRKLNTVPNNPNDGEVIGEIEHTFFQDSSGETGVTYFYGIFTKRRQEFSSNGAVSTALMKVADIEKLEALPSDRRISLKWQAPHNVNRVEVWTMPDREPTKRGEGKNLASIQNGGANHEQLDNDRLYGYLVIAVFKDVFGNNIFTSGTSILCAPMAPPQAVNSLSISKNEQGFDLMWQTKPNEQVDIYCSEKPYLYKLGEVLTIEELKKCGRLVPHSSPSQAYFRPQGHGIYYFLPVTSKGSLSIAGHAESMLHLEEVINLKGTYSDELLRLEWIFPTGVKKVQINYGNLVQVEQIEVSESDYQKVRAYFIRNIDSNLWDMVVKVKTVLETSTGKIYSKGIETTIRLRKTSVRFQVQTKSASWFSNTLKISLNITKEGVLTDSLFFVVKEHNKLISYKDLDRHDLLDITPEAFHFSDFKAEIEYRPSSKSVKNLFFSLITKNQARKDDIHIEDNGKKISL